MKSLKLLLLSLSFLSFGAFASNEIKWTITGTVVEYQTNESIPYATVALYSKNDSSLITGVITNDEGVFILEKITRGDYYLKISFMGYKDYTIDPLTLIASESNIALGVITLEPNVESLTEVVVNSKSSAIKNKVDKQIINVASNLSATGGTAIDALKLSPSIQIDSEDNVTLRGSANFIVLVNGKPTTLKPNDVLKQIPANSINKVEVITNPSVKYSAEGGAGIINIILKKGYNSGLNGIINASVGTKDKYSGDVNINLNKEKASYSFSASWRDYTRTAENNYYRTLYNDDNTHYATMFQDRRSTNSNLDFRFGMDYNPNDKTNLSYSFHTGYNKFDLEVLNTNAGYTIPESTEEHKYNPFYFDAKPTFFTNNLGFSKTLNESNDLLSFNVYYSYIDYDFSNYQYSYLTDQSENIVDNEPYRLNIFNRNNSNDVRFDVDYTNVISEKSKLETGASFHQYNRFLNLTYSEFDYGQNDWENHPDYTGKYTFNEGVYAVYTNLNCSVWGLTSSFGMRMEYTDRVLTTKNTSVEYKYHKANFFPGVSLNKKLNDNANAKFVLTNRINRPDEYFMNPYPEFQDDYFVGEGNPYLIPEIVRNYELGYNYNKGKTSFSSNLYYRTTKNKIEQKLVVEEDDKIHTMFHNDAGDKAFGGEFMYNFSLNDWWSVNANTNLFYYDIWANINGTRSQNNNFSWSAQLSNSIILGKNSSLQVIAHYASKTARSQGELSDYFFADIAYKKEFFDNRLTVNLQLKDVFQSLNYELKTHTSNMNLLGDFNNESPIAILNVSYKLSNFKKKTKDVQTEFDM